MLLLCLRCCWLQPWSNKEIILEQKILSRVHVQQTLLLYKTNACFSVSYKIPTFNLHTFRAYHTRVFIFCRVFSTNVDIICLEENSVAKACICVFLFLCTISSLQATLMFFLHVSWKDTEREKGDTVSLS